MIVATQRMGALYAVEWVDQSDAKSSKATQALLGIGTRLQQLQAVAQVPPVLKQQAAAKRAIVKCVAERVLQPAGGRLGRADSCEMFSSVGVCGAVQRTGRGAAIVKADRPRDVDL